MKYSKKWFTLVELVVVAVILSILATVWFISYEEYLVDTRDSKRLAQLTGLRDWLRLWITKWQLPLPDDNVEIRNNGTAFLYQWYAWANVLESISYSEATKDPFDDTYYTYLLSRNRKDFQLLWFLEEYNQSVISGITSTSYAIDYSQRFPQVMGKKLWILLEQDTNTPLQEMSWYQIAGYLDLQDSTTNEFDAYVTDTQLISWKEDDLIWIIPFTTCKKILETGWTYWNGIYNINPSWLNPFEVYCDMERDGWWWTLVARSVENAIGWNFWWLIKNGNLRDNNIPYSLWFSTVDLNFNEILVTTYEGDKTITKWIVLRIDKNFIKDESNHVDPGVDYPVCPQIISCRKESPLDTDWVSPCDSWSNLTFENGSVGDKSTRNRLLNWWLLHSTSKFAFSNRCRNFWSNWLISSWWTDDDGDGDWDFHPWSQWMIFVR